jgi:hypothetical protein
VQQVCLAESYAAVNEQRVICCAERFTDSDAACVRQPIAWAYDKTIECIIGMQAGFAYGREWGIIFLCFCVYAEGYAHKITCDLLSGSCKTADAVILQKSSAFGIRAADIERTAAEIFYGKTVEPFSTVGRVENFNPFDNRLKYFS